MRHPKNRFDKLIFLLKQSRNKGKYLKNIFFFYHFNIFRMIDEEWNAYVQILKDKRNEIN
jgi:hypothetical protein